MSFRIQASIFCDECHCVINSATEHRIGHAKTMLWKLRYQAERANWTFVSRGRYLTEAHYCPDCADKPRKPIPKPEIRLTTNEEVLADVQRRINR